MPSIKIRRARRALRDSQELPERNGLGFRFMSVLLSREENGTA